MKSNILELKNVYKRFGGLVAVNKINLQINNGSILGIIGPNGSGKSSLFNCIIGLYRLDNGEIVFEEEVITGKSTYEIIRSGMSRTFQVPKIFQDSTLLENMLTPVLHLRKKRSVLHSRASELLNWVNLGGKEYNPANELSGGQQKLLEFARSLMLDPNVVLLDEPFAGVHPNLKKVMSNGILELHKKGKTVLIVSHDMPSLYQLTSDIVVLDQGEMIARGTPDELQNNPTVVNAYFGR